MENFKELWTKHRTIVLVVGGVVGALVIYSFLKNRSSSASTGTAATTGSVSPTQYLIPGYGNGGSPDAGSTGTGTGGTTTTTTGNPSSGYQPGGGSGLTINPVNAQQIAPTAPKQYGYGQETIGGQQFTELGINSANGPQGFSGYNVSGGAPVYFLAPGHTTPTQGTGQAIQGAQVLVPSIYDSNVSATPNHPAAA